MTYNWQQPDWPNFKYDETQLSELLFRFSEKSGLISGSLASLPEDKIQETIIDFLVTEAMKSSEIEGEYMSREDVLSSIRNNLGLHETSKIIRDEKAKGIAQLMVDVRNSYKMPLSKEKLFQWHKMLLPQVPGHKKDMLVGAWRTHAEPMQVISGSSGRWTIHFEAPPSSVVPKEMKAFIEWFNKTLPGQEREILRAPIRAAIAHLYFETIHPFEDGNGRIGRAIAEKALSQGLGRPVVMSLSQSIEAHKKDYYDALKNAQRSNEITPWLKYFLTTLLHAQTEAEAKIKFVITKAKFWDKHSSHLNERQTKVLQRMFEEGSKGFIGGLNAKKYVAISKASKATATRDLQELLLLGALTQIGAGRSTRYELSIERSTGVKLL